MAVANNNPQDFFMASFPVFFNGDIPRAGKSDGLTPIVLASYELIFAVLVVPLDIRGLFI